MRLSMCLALCAMTVMMLSIPAQALPDLHLKDAAITYDPAPRGPGGSMEHLGPGQKIFVSGVVVNSGTGRIENSSVEMRVDGKVIGRQSIAGMRAGREEAFTFTWTPEGPGTSEVVIVVDPANQVRESDKSNNTFKEMVVIAYVTSSVASETDPPNAPKTDLVVEEIMIFPAPRMGLPSSITIDVSNRGEISAENIEVEISINGNRETLRTLALVPPDERGSLTYTWTPRARGSYEISVTADPEKKIRDANRENNRKVRSAAIRH